MCRNVNGFTLLEIVVSMLILSVVAAGSMSVIIMANKQVINAQHRLQAVSQASAVLEKLRYYVRADDTTVFTAGTHSFSDAGLSNTPSVDGVSGLQGNYTVPAKSGKWSVVTAQIGWDE